MAKRNELEAEVRKLDALKRKHEQKLLNMELAIRMTEIEEQSKMSERRNERSKASVQEWIWDVRDPTGKSSSHSYTPILNQPLKHNPGIYTVVDNNGNRASVQNLLS